MVKDPGDRLRQAQFINVRETPKRFSNQIGGGDRRDLFRFRLERRSSLNLSLTGLKSNVSLSLLNSRGNVLTQSRRPGRQSEAIVTPLDAGIYYVQITPASGRDSTRYKLTFSAANTPPQFITTTFSLRSGRTSPIGRDAILATDAEQRSSEIIYSVTNLPLNGRLQLDATTPLSLGSQFSQADIDNGRLSYTSLGRNTRLTNDALNDSVAGISGSNIVWNKVTGIQSSNAFFYNGQTKQNTQLTSNGILTSVVGGVSDSRAVWLGFNGVNIEVFLFDATTGISNKISNDGVNKISTAISGDNLIWTTFDGQAAKAFFYDGRSRQSTELKAPGVTTASANGISGSKVVWLGRQGSTPNTDVYIYDVTTGTSTKLTNTPLNVFFIAISGSNVIWTAQDINATKAFFYNLQTDQTIELTNPGIIAAAAVAVSDTHVLWNGLDSTDTEVFLYSITTGNSTQLTSNATADLGTGLSGSNAVWAGLDGVDSDIFFYDGTTTTQISNDTFNDGGAVISGKNIAWITQDETDTEVVLRDFPNRDQFSFTISDGLGGLSNGTLDITVNT